MEDATGKAGDSLWRAVTRIYDALRAHFIHDRPVLRALERVQGQPHDPEAAKDLAGQLQSRLARDPSFAGDLAALVEELSSIPESAQFLTVVQGNAHVGKITNIGSVEGDISF